MQKTAALAAASPWQLDFAPKKSEVGRTAPQPFAVEETALRVARLRASESAAGAVERAFAEQVRAAKARQAQSLRAQALPAGLLGVGWPAVAAALRLPSRGPRQAGQQVVQV